MENAKPIREQAMDYHDRNVLVTGGTGALGTAVVAALIEAGATCHVPWLHEGEAERFGYRDHKQVRLIGSVELTDEAAVGRLFGSIQPLWASTGVVKGPRLCHATDESPTAGEFRRYWTHRACPDPAEINGFARQFPKGKTGNFLS